MARKYSRDNRGRFASSGTGATARGGRLKTAAGNKRATQTSQMPAAPRAGTVGKGGSARGPKVAKTAASIQSPVARKDRVDLAAERKSYAGKLRSLPKEARKAIQIEKISRGKNMGNQAKPMANIAEGRMRLINNAGKRKNKLSPGEVDSIAKSMSGSARKLKAGMAMGSRGRARYNPNAVTPTGQGSAARKIQGAKPGGTVAKPRGLKQGAVTARVRAKEVAAKPRPDTAEANIPMRGARGKRLEASISRAVKEVKALQRARFMKPKEQVRAEAAARKAAKMSAAAAKPKRVRTPESLRLSRAKQVEKRRSINISNPAGNRAEASGRMAANAARTQQRALAFLKSRKPKGEAKPVTTARPTINRTRKQAAAAQLDRKRQTLENTKAIRGKQSLIAPEGISRRSVKVNQRNMLTGGIDRVTAKVQTKVQGERISPLSSFGRKNTARSERASNRLDTLIQARRNTPKPRKATERAALAKIQKSISTVTRSFDSYRNARSGRRTKKS